MGTLFLAGGSEFSQCMHDTDLQLIELAGGVDSPIRIIPAAAAPDHNDARAGNNGVRWFQSLGATDVQSLPVIDTRSAQDPSLAEALRKVRLIYLLGGFPQHLGQTLLGSAAWSSVLAAFREGAVIAGSSAGAMVLCKHYYDPYEKKFNDGLDLIHSACLIPHHNSSGAGWGDLLRNQYPGDLLIGVDECTGILQTQGGSEWTVLGRGLVSLYPPEGGVETLKVLSEGQVFKI
jgi:cyanophycinase